MQREYIKWKSPNLGREMELLVFGKKGTPVIVFPSDSGRFFEWEDEGMIYILEEQIELGYNQFFCVDSVIDESFHNKDVDPYTRIMRHEQYLMYIMEEIVPFITENNGTPYLINTGVGLGAYYSLLLALKYPSKFNKIISLSGHFDIKHFMNGFYDDNVYYNNPVDFISNLNNTKILKAIRKLDIRLLTYQNDMNLEPSKKMSEVLAMKSLDNRFYIWDETTYQPWSLFGSMFKENLI